MHNPLGSTALFRGVNTTEGNYDATYLKGSPPPLQERKCDGADWQSIGVAREGDAPSRSKAIRAIEYQRRLSTRGNHAVSHLVTGRRGIIEAPLIDAPSRRRFPIRLNREAEAVSTPSRGKSTEVRLWCAGCRCRGIATPYHYEDYQNDNATEYIHGEIVSQ